MLADEKKQEIRLEEEYRFQIRRELESSQRSKRWYETVWSVLNSTFTIFVLGSIVLVSITSYLEYKRQENLTRDTRIRRALELAEEIKWRITNIEIAVERSVHTPPYLYLSTDALQEIREQADGNSCLQEKFKNKKLATLLRDLKNIQLERDYEPFWSLAEHVISRKKDVEREEYVKKELSEDFDSTISFFDEFERFIHHEPIPGEDYESTPWQHGSSFGRARGLNDLLDILSRSKEFIDSFLEYSPVFH